MGTRLLLKKLSEVSRYRTTSLLSTGRVNNWSYSSARIPISACFQQHALYYDGTSVPPTLNAAPRRAVHAATWQEEATIAPEPNLNGPDQIIPAKMHKCWLPSDPVSLHITKEGLESIPPVSVHTLLKNIARKHPDKPAVAIKRDGEWKYMPYKEYFEGSRTIAKALLKLGLDRFHGVCLMGFNCPEWFMSYFGTIFAGGIAAGINVNSSADAAAHVAEDSKAQFVIVDTEETANKFLSMKHLMPHLKAIVQYSGTPVSPDVLSWDQFMAVGRNESDDLLESTLQTQAVNQCCCLIYTSGTTSNPKGVMCSQDNLTWTGKLINEIFRLREGEERFVSYLPLNHIAGQMVDLFVAPSSAGTVYCAQPDALKGSLIHTLKEASPTNLLTVPRLLEKMHEQIMFASGQASPVKRTVLEWARKQCLNYHLAENSGRKASLYEKYCYNVARTMVINKIKALLGLSEIYNIATGSAPISDDIIKFFFSLDLPIVNKYGSSESLSTGTIAYTKYQTYKAGSIGKDELSLLYPETYNEDTLGVKIFPTSLTSGLIEGEGEIAFRGRYVFMGYLNNEQKTHETILDDGWMLTGDLGWLDEDDHVYITGRLKELIITAGGENIPPILIEEEILKQLPIVANAMVVGDGRKYLSVLLTLKSERDETTGEPLDTLTPGVKEWLQEKDCNCATVSQVRELIKSDPDCVVAREIQAGIDRYNMEKAVSNVHQIKKWALLPNEFSLNTGELTQTLKLKRNVVSSVYSDVIDSMYDQNDSPSSTCLYN